MSRRIERRKKHTHTHTRAQFLSDNYHNHYESYVRIQPELVVNDVPDSLCTTRVVACVIGLWIVDLCGIYDGGVGSRGPWTWRSRHDILYYLTIAGRYRYVVIDTRDF